jgi:uncharacterized protein DUF6308
VAPEIRIELRHGLVVVDPLAVVLEFVQAEYAYDVSTASAPSRFGESDLRLANRGGARISAAEIAAVVERRRAIERALRAIADDASLTRAAVPWLPMQHLFAPFAGIRGIGFAKMTKALHKKRPALIPSTTIPVSTPRLRSAQSRSSVATSATSTATELR